MIDGFPRRLIARMTQNTQALVTGAPEVVFKHRAIARIMTGDTVHRLTITWVESLVTHGVTEIAVALMTVNARAVVIFFPHRRQIAAVQLMTINTTVRMGVNIQTVGAARELALMTLAACVTRGLFDQAILTTGVRVMAVKTAVGFGSIDPVTELTIK
jgi:hypothetical protein